jgi:hypothetical protein
MLSGIAAHCDPTLFGGLGGESRTITGAAYVKPSREVRISSVRQYSSGRMSYDAFAQPGERRRGLSFLSEKRGNACWKPLVLSRRSRHQTPLLVSSGSRGNPPARSRAVLPLRQANLFTTRDRYAAFGIRRSRRTTRAAKLRTAYWRFSLNPDDAGGRCTYRQQRRPFTRCRGKPICYRLTLARTVRCEFALHSSAGSGKIGCERANDFSSGSAAACRIRPARRRAKSGSFVSGAAKRYRWRAGARGINFNRPARASRNAPAIHQVAHRSGQCPGADGRRSHCAVG